MDGLIMLVGLPLAFAAGAVIGRWMQRRLWRMDLPYDERLKYFGLK